MEVPSPVPGTAISLEEQISRGVRALQDGGVIAVPTDTLYGLAACAFDVAAVRRIFRIKGRPEGMAIPLLVGDVGDLAEYAVDIPEIAWVLAEAFLPGPLTLVLRKHRSIPDIVTGGKNTVALRVPDHLAPRSIARELGAPITGTSANRSGEPSLVTAEDVELELGGELDYVVAAGPVPGNTPSTLVDVTRSEPRILRLGAVSREDIEGVLSGVVSTIASRGPTA